MPTVAPTKSKLVIKRNGKTTTRLVPLPTVIVDSREQMPYRFSMRTGDYSISGFEDVISLERKSLNDIVGSLMDGRSRFLREMDRLAEFKYKVLCIEATRSEIKSPYTFHSKVKAHPNGIMGSLDAIAARYGITVHYGDNRLLCEEFAASWLSKCYTYEWLEKNNHGRVLQEGDL